MTITILPAISARIAAIEAAREPLDERALSAELEALIADPQNLTADQRLGCVAEIIGHRFGTLSNPESGPWGIYFAPVASGTTADGQEVHMPDARRIDAEVIDYWKKRSEQTPHPTLCARYADLAWEIGRLWNREHPDARIDLPPMLAQRAVDAYLEAAEAGLARDNFQGWRFLNRALGLALLIHDRDRADRAKRSAFAYCRKLQAAGDSGFWWSIDNLVWGRKGIVLTDAERDGLIGWLEAALTASSDISDEKHFNPHQSLDAADRLRRWREKMGQPEMGLVALRTAGAAFEAIAAKANALTGIAWLEDLSLRYRQAKLKDDASRVDAAIRSRSAEAQQSMKRVETKIEVPQEETQKWLDELTDGSLDLALSRIAANMMTSEVNIRQMLEGFASDAPLYASTSISIMGLGGFTSATIGSIKDDMPGRILSQAADVIGASAPWLHQALVHAQSRWQMDSDHLVKWLLQSSFFPPHAHGLLTTGIDAWFTGDTVKAIHVLVPQVEAALREMLSAMGESPMRAKYEDRSFEALGMGAILSTESFKTKLDPTLRLHLRALYTDPKGINLRNKLAHGIAGPELLDRGIANWVIHSMLAIRAHARF